MIQSVQLRPGGGMGGLTQRKPAWADQRPVNFSKFCGNLLFYKWFPKWLGFCARCTGSVPALTGYRYHIPPEEEDLRHPLGQIGSAGKHKCCTTGMDPVYSSNQVLWLVCGSDGPFERRYLEIEKKPLGAKPFFSFPGCFESCWNILA